MSNQQYIEQLFGTMGQLRKLFEKHVQELHEDKTSTFMQFSALKFLKMNENNTVGDIAAYLRLSKSSATQLIERLAKSGLVDRIDDKEDRRIVHVVITQTGIEKLIEMKKRFIGKMAELLKEVPEADLKELVRRQTILIETLQQK